MGCCVAAASTVGLPAPQTRLLLSGQPFHLLQPILCYQADKNHRQVALSFKKVQNDIHKVIRKGGGTYGTCGITLHTRDALAIASAVTNEIFISPLLPGTQTFFLRRLHVSHAWEGP